MCAKYISMSEGIENSELIELTIRKLNGEVMDGDEQKLNKLLSEDPANRKTHDELVKTWEGVQNAAGMTEVETHQEWLRLQTAIRQPASSRNTSWYRIAAVVALLIAATAALFSLLTGSERNVLAASIESVTLPDGSSVTLNAGASLSYPPEFKSKERAVTLEGEAFFDVKPNAKQPFIIHTSRMVITVVGTSFTVRAHQEAPSSEVVVMSGKVQLSVAGKSIVLEAGEKGTLSKESGQLFKTVNADLNFQSWKTKEFTFEDDPLIEVIEILNNAYQSKLYLNPSNIADCPITVSFEGRSLEDILEVLKATLGLSVVETPRGLEVSGEGC